MFKIKNKFLKNVMFCLVLILKKTVLAHLNHLKPPVSKLNTLHNLWSHCFQTDT